MTTICRLDVPLIFFTSSFRYSYRQLKNAAL